jgi:N-acetylmuramic acid 6-phosphate etherase
MVGMRATNAKLRGRTLRILREATGQDMHECSEALDEARGDLKVALVHMLAGVDAEQAARALADADGHVRKALMAVRATV